MEYLQLPEKINSSIVTFNIKFNVLGIDKHIAQYLIAQRTRGIKRINDRKTKNQETPQSSNFEFLGMSSIPNDL